MVFEKVRPTVAARPVQRGVPPERSPRRGRTALLRRQAALAGTAVLGLLLIAALVELAGGGSAFNVAPALTSQWRPGIVAVLMVAFAGGLVLHSDPRATRLGGALRTRMRTRTSRITWWVFVAACFAGQLILAHAVLQLSTWDAMQIFEVAYHMAVAPEPRLFSVGDQTAYFVLYPNNTFLVAVFAALFGVLRAVGLAGIDQYLWASVVVNCVALTGTLVLIRIVARRLAPGFATRVAVALGVVLVILSPWLNVAYSDSLAMAFPIGMLAIWLTWPDRASTRSSVLLFLTLGVLAGIGLAIKPPVVFMAPALLLATARSSTGPQWWKGREGITAAVALIAGLGLTHVVVGGIVHALVPQFGTGGGMPFAHYLAMGSTGDGGFNVDDFNRTFALPEGARSSAALHLWIERMTAMGPLGYPFFLAQKVLYALSDGSFFQDREGIGPYSRAFFSSDPFSQAVQTVFPLGTPLHFLLASLWQAAWWSAVLLCFVPLRRLRLPRGGAVLAMRVSLLLLLAFLCLSESRSRYLYHYLPIVLVLAGLGAAALTAELGALRARVGRRRRSAAPEIAASAD